MTPLLSGEEARQAIRAASDATSRARAEAFSIMQEYRKVWELTAGSVPVDSTPNNLQPSNGRTGSQA